MSASPPERPGQPAWRDADDRLVDAPEPPASAFYRPIGDFQGELYRRNAFAMGTENEVAALERLLDLHPGDHVLDVGCGNGRHLRALADRGLTGVGVDVSAGLLRAAADEAAPGTSFVQADARRPPIRAGSFDAAWSVCQGGLGTDPATDTAVLGGLVRSVRAGGRVAFTLFSALFAARHLAPGDAFDPVRLLHHQVSEVVGRDGERRRFDLWTATYTPRDALEVAASVGLEVTSLTGVEPGAYDRAEPPGLDAPEILVVGRVVHRQ